MRTDTGAGAYGGRRPGPRALGVAVLQLLPLLIFLAGPLTSPARANDAYAEQGAGGLVFTAAPAGLRLLSEDLTLAVDRVRVVYVFENRTGAPVTARVAFPLPSVSPTHPDLMGHDPGAVTDLAFTTTVDGRPVAFETERRAFGCVGGTWHDTGAAHHRCCADFDWETGACSPGADTPEVTALLDRHGLLDEPDRVRLAERVAALPAGAAARLAEAGAVQVTDGTPGPNWSLRLVHHREQTFPPGRPVRVEHVYAPLPGGAIWGPNDLGRAGTLWAVRYILTTAATWSGPIDRFRLSVQPLDDAPGGVIVVAGLDGLTARPDGSAVAARTEFVPRHDLTVTWFPSASAAARQEGPAAYLTPAFNIAPGADDPPHWISPNAWSLPPGRFPGASTRRLTAADLEGFTAADLAQMRNEIYARHGYVFRSARWRDHFRVTDWYRPGDGGPVTLTPLEQANVAAIRAAEEAAPAQ